MENSPSIRFTLRSKLILVALSALFFPLISLYALQEAKTFLLDGQARSQLQLAEAIALRVQPLYPELRSQPTGDTATVLPVFPIEGQIAVDGYNEDWGALSQLPDNYGGQQSGFELVLAENGHELFIWVNVRDSDLHSRHPGEQILDQHDQVRLRFTDNSGLVNHLLIPYEGTGKSVVLTTDASWLRLQSHHSDLRFTAFTRQTETGYQLEIGVPLHLIADSPTLSLQTLDISAKKKPQTSETINILERQDNPLLFRSKILQQNLAQLSAKDTRVWLLNQQLQVKAVSGELQSQAPYGVNGIGLSPGAWFANWMVGNYKPPQLLPAQTTVWRQEAQLGEALEGSPLNWQQSGLLTSAYPVINANQTGGLVVIEQSVSSLLDKQRHSLASIINMTLSGFFAIGLVVLIFAGRLTTRIRLLDSSTRKARDMATKLDADYGIHSREGGDELDGLARNIDLMLGELREHQQFLRNIPRTLRHEINNPLNTISTSLESLSEESKSRDAKQLESAHRGLQRIGQMVQSLADAASLESALTSEEQEALDINAMLCSYLRNRERLLGDTVFDITAPDNALVIDGCDLHLEQMFDKIIDNALDFRAPGTPVLVAIGAIKNSVLNRCCVC